MLDFFFRYFLVFPKIQFLNHWGILIGELALLLYLFLYAPFAKEKIKLHSTIVSYYLFVIYFTLVSSSITALIFGFFPTHSILYVSRLILCFGLFVWAYNYYPKIPDNALIVRKVYNKPFYIHFAICIVIMIFYYTQYKPSANLILWGYEVGLRMIPLAGLVIDTDSFFFLKAVSGSGNLLAGWSLALLILNFNLKKTDRSQWLVVFAILTVLLTISRGGFLTMSLYFVYVYFKEFDFKISIRTLVGSIVFLTLMILYFSLSNEIPLPNIFERLTNTYDGGGFDGSTQGRLDNYIQLLSAWITKLHYIIFGFGFDENALLITANATVVESYFLEVLVCSGLIGTLLFAIFYLMIFVNRRNNFWYKCCWEFLLFQSIVQWTVTGGDFLAPHATYIFLTFMGFGLASSLNAGAHE